MARYRSRSYKTTILGSDRVKCVPTWRPTKGETTSYRHPLLRRDREVKAKLSPFREATKPYIHRQEEALLRQKARSSVETPFHHRKFPRLPCSNRVWTSEKPWRRCPQASPTLASCSIAQCAALPKGGRILTAFSLPICRHRSTRRATVQVHLHLCCRVALLLWPDVPGPIVCLVPVM